MFLRLNTNAVMSLFVANRRVHLRTRYTEQSAAAVYTAHQAVADLLFSRKVESVIYIAYSLYSPPFYRSSLLCLTALDEKQRILNDWA